VGSKVVKVFKFTSLNKFTKRMAASLIYFVFCSYYLGTTPFISTMEDDLIKMVTVKDFSSNFTNRQVKGHFINSAFCSIVYVVRQYSRAVTGTELGCFIYPLASGWVRLMYA